MDHRGRGSIDLILGPVYAGKTSELLRRVRRFEFAKLKCLVVRHESTSLDREDIQKAYQKYEFGQFSLQSHTKVVSSRSLSQIETICNQYHVIAVDDGHLFSDLGLCETLASTNNKKVIVSSLDGTRQQQPFLAVSQLVAQCETLEKLSAICMACGSEAAFTKQLKESNVCEPSCRRCLKL